MAKLKTKILLEMINDVAIKYPDTRDFIEQTLTEKWISIDEVIFFLVSPKAKKFYKPNMYIKATIPDKIFGMD